MTFRSGVPPGAGDERSAKLQAALAALTPTRATPALGRAGQVALLLEHSPGLIPASAIGAELPKPRQLLHPAGATTAAARIFGAEADQRRGPSHEAFATGHRVAATTLTAANSAWPGQRQAAQITGYAGMLAVPMRTDGTVLGVLAVYRASSSGFSSTDHTTAHKLANAAALGLAHPDPDEAEGAVVDHFHEATRRRVQLEQTTGILAHLTHPTPQQAQIPLHQHADKHHRTVADLAHHLLNIDSWPPDEPDRHR